MCTAVYRSWEYFANSTRSVILSFFVWRLYALFCFVILFLKGFGLLVTINPVLTRWATGSCLTVPPMRPPAKFERDQYNLTGTLASFKHSRTEHLIHESLVTSTPIPILPKCRSTAVIIMWKWRLCVVLTNVYGGYVNTLISCYCFVTLVSILVFITGQNHNGANWCKAVNSGSPIGVTTILSALAVEHCKLFRESDSYNGR